MKQFDFYEFAGILAPGAITIFGASLIYPSISLIAKASGASFGDLGVFIILSYAAGHLVQFIGNRLETLHWKIFKGMPTDWVISGRGNLISPDQQRLLETRLQKLLGRNEPVELSKIAAAEWTPITRQIHAAIGAANRLERIERFNGNYGLCRGIAASLLVVAALLLWEKGPGSWRPVLFFGVLVAIALARMHRFGCYYARELFVQFLNLPTS
ncbi:MAG: hypothetical protein KIT79_09660 [Deltaproteobacteria bacterium]|nr:hypothetical protein [Deltaproteobacteria bacterium]